MCTLNSKCNTKVASGLAAQNCQFDNPSHNLAWCSFPDEPNSKQVHPFSAPHKNLQDSSQRYFIDQDPGTTHLAGNLASLKLTKNTFTTIQRNTHVRTQDALKTHRVQWVFRTEFRRTMYGVENAQVVQVEGQENRA